MYRSADQSSESSDDSVTQSLIEEISIPYCGRLPQKLIVGSFVEIFGKIDENGDRFAINLMTDSDDIALHFNPRLNEGCVIRNSRIDNVWCNEEREPIKMPFEKNQSFTLILNASDEHVFRIFINGIHFIDFKHRLPFTAINSIAIDGELQVLWIKCDRIPSDQSFDAFSTSLASSTPLTQQPNEIQNFFDPKVPFIEDIRGGLKEGMVLSIIGRSLSNAKNFVLNLNQKKESVRTPNITFHMSVRFDKNKEKSLVVRNYRFDGEWGNEDRYSTEFPFVLEKIFDLRIIVESNRFIIVINGKIFTEFPIRLYPLSDTNQLEIEGNLRLLSVRF